MKDALWLEWMAGLMGETSGQTSATMFPPDRFFCLLDELPVHLVPCGQFDILRSCPEKRLELNPDCMFCTGEQLPKDIALHGQLVDGFALRGTTVWVRDIKRHALLPFWLGPRLEFGIERVQSGESVDAVFSLHDQRVLAAAGILRAKDSWLQESDVKPFQQQKESFEEKEYVSLSQLLHPFHTAALRRYYRYLLRSGFISSRDDQCSRRYVAHNEPASRFFHAQLAKTVSIVSGEAVKPSYVYFAAYQSGAELGRHTDRRQCELSISLCLDFSPEPENQTPWPLWIDTREGPVAIRQALGDGLLFRGARLPHYRDVLGEGMTSTSIFFHYVPESFSESLS